MGKLDYIADGQMSLFNDGFLEEQSVVTPEWTCAFTTPVIDNGKPAFRMEDGQVVNLGDVKPICQFSGHTCNKQSVWEVADSLDDKDDCPHICCRNCEVKGCGARCNGSEEPKKKEEQVTSTDVSRKECSNCMRFNMDIEQPPEGWGNIGWCSEHNEKTHDISYCQSWEPKPVESIQYTTEEYAKAIVKHLIEHCRRWGMTENIKRLRESKTTEVFHKLFCKVTRTYYVDLYEWYFNVEFCQDNTVNIKRCGRDFSKRGLDATIQLQDVLNEL